MKATTCPTCSTPRAVSACDVTTCNRPSIGRCCLCRMQTCNDHGGLLYGVVLCYHDKEAATVAQVDRAAKVAR